MKYRLGICTCYEYCNIEHTAVKFARLTVHRRVDARIDIDRNVTNSTSPSIIYIINHIRIQSVIVEVRVDDGKGYLRYGSARTQQTAPIVGAQGSIITNTSA